MDGYSTILLLCTYYICCTNGQIEAGGDNYYYNVILPRGKDCDGTDNQRINNGVTFGNCQKGERGPVGKAGPKVE